MFFIDPPQPATGAGGSAELGFPSPQDSGPGPGPAGDLEPLTGSLRITAGQVTRAAAAAAAAGPGGPGWSSGAGRDSGCPARLSESRPGRARCCPSLSLRLGHGTTSTIVGDSAGSSGPAAAAAGSARAGPGSAWMV